MNIHSSPRILVADDMPLNFLFLESVLSLAHCEPVCVRSGRAALEAFVADTFDLVMLDCRMPNGDGIQALRLIRIYESVRARSRTPVLMMSASQEDRQLAREAGCDAYLEKPLDKNLLLRALGKHLPVFQGLSVITTSVPDGLPAGIRPPVAGFPRHGIR